MALSVASAPAQTTTATGPPAFARGALPVATVEAVALATATASGPPAAARGAVSLAHEVAGTVASDGPEILFAQAFAPVAAVNTPAVSTILTGPALFARAAHIPAVVQGFASSDTTVSGPPIIARGQVPTHSDVGGSEVVSGAEVFSARGFVPSAAVNAPPVTLTATGAPAFARATVPELEVGTQLPLVVAGPPAFARAEVPRGYAQGISAGTTTATGPAVHGRARVINPAQIAGTDMAEGVEVLSAYAVVGQHQVNTYLTVTRPPTSVVDTGAWVNGQNAYTDDAAVASTLNSSRNVPYYLDLGGFNFSALPVGANVVSVQVTTQAWKQFAAMEVTESVQLYNGATPLGTEQTRTLVATADGTAWVTTWTVPLSDLQSPTFTLRYGSNRTGTSTGSTLLDFVSVQAFYQPAATVTAAGSLSLFASAGWAVGATGSLTLTATAGAAASVTASAMLNLNATAAAPVPPGFANGMLNLFGSVGQVQARPAAAGSLSLQAIAFAAPGVFANGSLSLFATAAAGQFTPVGASGMLSLFATANAQAKPVTSGGMLNLFGLVGSVQARPVAAGSLHLRMAIVTATSGWYEYLGGDLIPLTMAGEWNGSGYTPLSVMDWPVP